MDYVEGRRRKRKSGKGKKIILSIVIVLILLLVSGILFLRLELGNLSHFDIDESSLSASEDLKDYQNIVVLGVDTRDMSKFEGSRSDSIIIVSLNRKTGEIKLVSVYRDTYLDIENVGLDKVTHAFAYGGPEKTINTLNRNMDLNIKDFVALNFRTVQKIVDGVGGIDVEIAEDEISQMNQYLPETGKYLKSDYKLIEHAGMQHLDGVQAVTYSRIRHTEGGDYKRTERMRTVLTAVFKEVKHTNPVAIHKMLKEVLPEISTNLKSSDLMPLIMKLPTADIEGSIGWPYDKESYTSPSTGTWYAAPNTLESNVKRLHEEVFYQKDYEPSQGVKNISANVSYATGYYGN